MNAIEAAGGRIVYVYNGPMVRAALDVAKIPDLVGYVAVVDDARVPQVRALPGVMFAGFDAVACLQSSR